MFSLNRLGAEALGHLGFLDVYATARRAITHRQAAIIMYHRVDSAPPPWLSGAIAPEDFAREIAYLCKVAEIVPLDWLVNQLYEGKSIPPRAVCLTFDDGYKDNYTFAYPILKKYNAPATIFLATGRIGNSPIFPLHKVRFAIWNTGVTRFEVEGLGGYHLNSPVSRLSVMEKIQAHLLKLPEQEQNLTVERLLKVLHVNPPDNLGGNLMLSWDEVLEMSQNGISFGAHTVAHPILTQLPIEEAREEISRSKTDIEEKLGKPCTLFAYPNGDFNAEIVQLVRESDFIAAVTTVPKLLNKQPQDPLLLPRISAGPNFYTCKGSFSGLYPDLRSVLRRVRGQGTSLGSR